MQNVPDPDERDIMLKADNLFKSYRKGSESFAVLKGMSFSVRRGECYGPLGPNGAGKTTTLRACLGLIATDSGTVELVGHSVPQQSRVARQRVGVVPQSDSLDPDFTVEENLLVFGRYFGMADEAIRKRIPYLLEFSSLVAKRTARIGELSGGMRRRLTLARALVNDPDLIFMDEPTTGLDPQARHMIWERLKSLLASGKTILLTTHFMDEAERLCDRLAVIDEGQVITQGEPRELIRQHIEPDVIEVYGDGARQWIAGHGALLDQSVRQSARIEQSGETWFVYTTAGDALVASLKAAPQVRYLYRPANLEDLFLKLTGRGMRD